MRFRSRISATVLALLSAVTAASAAPPTAYHLLKKVTLPGEDGWDYLTCDSANARLFITRGSHVQVVSIKTGEEGKILADLTDTKGCHGVALAPEFNRGFISDGGDNQVTIFDTKTLKVIGTTPVGQRPDAILYDPATKHVFTFNAQSQDATALDAATGKPVGTVALGGKPEFAQSDGAGHIFVNIEDKSELVTFDAKALTVIRRTSLAPAEEPSGLARDPKTNRLFAACGNEKAAVVDGNTGKLLGTPTIGGGPDAAAFDPGTGLAFTSNGDDGTLSVLKETAPGTYTATNVVTAPRARTMTLDPKTHRIYTVTAEFTPPPADAPTVNGRRPRPQMVPGSFTLLIYGQ